GLRNEGAAVGLRPRQGDEQGAGHDLTAVGGDGGDLRVGSHIAAQQFGETQVGAGKAHRPSPSTSWNSGIFSPSAVDQRSALRSTPRKPAIRLAMRPTAGAAT